ncbi:MAG: hypothetical protein V2I33_23625 [Kangiellaceae bacterium]|nr:hypothetical protein [Kangiellaceae bacterium]
MDLEFTSRFYDLTRKLLKSLHKIDLPEINVEANLTNTIVVEPDYENDAKRCLNDKIRCSNAWRVILSFDSECSLEEDNSLILEYYEQNEEPTTKEYYGLKTEKNNWPKAPVIFYGVNYLRFNYVTSSEQTEQTQQGFKIDVVVEYLQPTIYSMINIREG